MNRFTMRIEVWEKDPETNEVFDEFGEVYFRDGNKYFKFNKNNEFIEIPNPFKGRIPLRPFNKTCRKLYKLGLDSGCHLLGEHEVLSLDGYPIDSIDIIFKERDIFPVSCNDNSIRYNIYQLIDDKLK